MAGAAHCIGPASTIATALDTAASALRTLALAFGTRRGRMVVRDAAAAAGRELDELLLSPIRDEVAQRPLGLVSTAGLHAVPWGLLPSLSDVPVRCSPRRRRG